MLTFYPSVSIGSLSIIWFNQFGLLSKIMLLHVPDYLHQFPQHILGTVTALLYIINNGKW